MPLTAEGLSSLVYADYLSAFPTAAVAMRENVATGVLTHNVPEAFIGALCDAFVTSILTMTITDLGSGASDVPGASPPAVFTFPGYPAASALFLATEGWVGVSGALAADAFIGNVLVHASAQGMIQMIPNLALGTGTGIIGPSDPALEAAMLAALLTNLPLSFQATGKFGEGDIPGAVTNTTLSASLPAYASALAYGVGTITAQVIYTGTATTTAPISGIVNTGSIL